jgi:tRNA pseudouridine55 synthase
MFGILNLNKPTGITSRDAINQIQRLVRPAKVGHAGTLDPIASGVLLVCIGPATRLIEYLQKMPKRYRATFQLGCQSPSDDTEGEVTPLADAPIVTRMAIEQLLPQFEGTILQRPPIYSAIKVAGRRSYDLARQGKAVPLPPRPVTIDQLMVTAYSYPTLELEIACGSGTYVRSLGRDLAAALGTSAVMSALVRTEIGHFSINRAIHPDALTKETISGQLQSPLEALSEIPRMILSNEQVKELHHGRFIDAGPWQGGAPIAEVGLAGSSGAKEAVAINAAGRLVAIVTPKAGGRWGPVRNFIVDH